MRLILAALVAALCATADAVCCYPRRFSFNELKCGDGTPLTTSGYCGYGECNIFGCACRFGCQYARYLRFEAGDIIACYIDTAPSDAPDWHVMVAINSTDVLHIGDPRSVPNAATKHWPSDLLTKDNPIRHVSFERIIHLYDNTHCQVVTKFMDRVAKEYYGLEPLQSIDTTAHIKDINTKLHKYIRFNPVCEYVATAWRYGMGFSVQHVSLLNKWFNDLFRKIIQ